MHQENINDNAVVFGADALKIEDIGRIARGDAGIAISGNEGFRSRVRKGVDFLNRLLREDGVIYGVTTGYGDSCTVGIPLQLVNELPLHLTRFHGCGLGDYFDIESGRAIMAARLASLCQGYSGVRFDLIELLARLLNDGIVSRIPEEGSVGASGDLTPLSYVAATLIGEREVYYGGRVVSAKDALLERGLQPLVLQPKEGLALMNGTAVMTALACLAYGRAEYLARISTRITALCSLALRGNASHFDEQLFRVKPHQGQAQVAAWLRTDLGTGEDGRNSSRLQDRYSIRCAPHIIGVLMDFLPWVRTTIETELNSTNDNPVIDGENERVLHGGHFYGGHIALAMDSLKNCVANLADLLDRQLALLVDTKFSNGLPANLSAAPPERRHINHGFKAVQIGVSAWTAEALKNTMPASVFSRSTECHNQDKVSMGTIAARDCIRNLVLCEQVVSAVLLAAHQAVELRIRAGELREEALSAGLTAFRQQVSAHFVLLEEDRPLESDLRYFMNLLREKYFVTYDTP